MGEWLAGSPIWVRIGSLSLDFGCCPWGTGAAHCEPPVNKIDDRCAFVVLAQSHEHRPRPWFGEKWRPRTSQDGSERAPRQKGADERSSRRRPDRKTVRAFVFPACSTLFHGSTLTHSRARKRPLCAFPACHRIGIKGFLTVSINILAQEVTVPERGSIGSAPLCSHRCGGFFRGTTSFPGGIGFR